MVAVLRRAWSFVPWVVTLEIGIWRSLFLWLTRHVPGQGPGVQSFAYAKEVTPLLWVFIFVSALEVTVVDLLLPWETVRLVALVIGVWGLLWMVGYLASMRVFRHLLDDTGLRIRHGTTVDIRIPWEAIDSVAARRGSAPTSKSVHVERRDDGTLVHVPVLKQTKAAVMLHRPTAVKLPDGTQEIAELRLYVDDPRAFVAMARERLADGRSPEQLAG